MKKQLKRRYFTLVELMIAGTISLTIITGTVVLFLQLLDVNRDCTAEVILSRGSKLIKQKLIRKFKLGQAIWEDTKTVSKTNISFKVVDADVEFPDLFSTKKQNMIIHFNPGHNKLVGQGIKGEKNTTLNNTFNVSVEEFDVSKQEVSGGDLLATKKVEVKYLLRLVHSGKTYYRQDSLVTPMMNFER